MSNTNASLFERGQAVIPGGVNSPVRAFGSVGGTPYFVERADGPFVYDVEGRRYIDYVQSYGPSILGHAHPDVIAAIRDAATRGTSYGAPTENEVRIAEEMTSRVEGLEMMRLVSSGTEAAMSAIRLARGATGRSKILKFAGNYHGHTDSLLVAGGSGIAQQGLKGSEGVTAGAIEDTIVAPYNVVPEIDESIAVVCVEPIAANMGLVPPAPGFLEGLREACDAAGAMLLFDEVITGFRLCRGGAAEWFGVQPDVWCFGKVIGGGLPMGAYGASRKIMSNVAPLGGVYQAGTLSGNPLATGASQYRVRSAYAPSSMEGGSGILFQLKPTPSVAKGTSNDEDGDPWCAAARAIFARQKKALTPRFSFKTTNTRLLSDCLFCKSGLAWPGLCA